MRLLFLPYPCTTVLSEDILGDYLLLKTGIVIIHLWGFLVYEILHTIRVTWSTSGLGYCRFVIIRRISY